MEEFEFRHSAVVISAEFQIHDFFFQARNGHVMHVVYRPSVKFYLYFLS